MKGEHLRRRRLQEGRQVESSDTLGLELRAQCSAMRVETVKHEVFNGLGNSPAPRPQNGSGAKRKRSASEV